MSKFKVNDIVIINEEKYNDYWKVEFNLQLKVPYRVIGYDRGHPVIQAASDLPEHKITYSQGRFENAISVADHDMVFDEKYLEEQLKRIFG